MKNIYDDEAFFKEYAKMERSQGLNKAGEWYQLKEIFPDVKDKNVLDLGCGYGWHCKEAVRRGAKSVLGIDMSMKMIQEAESRNADEKITYRNCGIEEYEYPMNTYDLVISNFIRPSKSQEFFFLISNILLLLQVFMKNGSEMIRERHSIGQ